MVRQWSDHANSISAAMRPSHWHTHDLVIVTRWVMHWVMHLSEGYDMWSDGIRILNDSKSSVRFSEPDRIMFIHRYSQQQQQPFYDPLCRTTQVSRYQKKHSPTHHPDHHPTFIIFFHLPWSIASSLFKLRAWQSFCTTSFHCYSSHTNCNKLLVTSHTQQQKLTCKHPKPFPWFLFHVPLTLYFAILYASQTTFCFATHYDDATLEMTYGMRGTEFLPLREIL